MLSNFVYALLGALPVVLAGGRPSSIHNWLEPLPKKASKIELRYQPVMHFDHGTCYNTAAIDIHGNTHEGASPLGACPWDNCREAEHLEHNNVYSRMRCNNGYCAIMYDYYFPKDQTVCGSWGVGHRHDWENVVVFVHKGKVVRVAPSSHGGYSGASDEPFMRYGRPAVVYYQDGPGLTHCIRMGELYDDYSLRNHQGGWFLGDLVGWDSWPGKGYKGILLEKFPGRVSPNFITHADFAEKLKKAAGDKVPGFDPFIDGDMEDPFHMDPFRTPYEYIGEILQLDDETPGQYSWDIEEDDETLYLDEVTTGHNSGDSKENEDGDLDEETPGHNSWDIEEDENDEDSDVWRAAQVA